MFLAILRYYIKLHVYLYKEIQLKFVKGRKGERDGVKKGRGLRHHKSFYLWDNGAPGSAKDELESLWSDGARAGATPDGSASRSRLWEQD